MYEELRGDLAAWATHFHFNDETSLLLCKAADAIEELQKQLREEKVDNVNLTGWLAEEHAKHLWIPVTERLPDNDCNCIVFSDGYVKEAHFYYGKFYDPIEDYMRYKATHWMPLPSPPVEE